MRVLVAPNSFKNCLGAGEVAEALARGAQSAHPRLEIDLMPLSDGGDGLVSVLKNTLGGEIVVSDTLDALGRPIKAAWLQRGCLAIIEMAAASGLARLKGPSEYAPLNTSTFGTGILINAALGRGCREMVIGLGGSATVDAGCGMALALGFRLEDAAGNPISRNARGLRRLSRIRFPVGDESSLKGVKATALADVANPLLGETGAARMFAPQKGATPEEVERLERDISSWASIVERDIGVSVSTLPGAGAAGGMGAGCVAFLGASLEPGAEWVAIHSGLPAAINRADLVFTGEGRIDGQTRLGKVPACVGRMARAAGKPVIAFGGSVAGEVDAALINADLCIEVSPNNMSLDEAVRSAPENLKKAAAKAIGHGLALLRERG